MFGMPSEDAGPWFAFFANLVPLRLKQSESVLRTDYMLSIRVLDNSYRN